MTPGVGTFRWMAPEIMAHRQYDHRVDAYSFSIVLWEMCTSDVPFSRIDSVVAICDAVSTGARPDGTP